MSTPYSPETKGGFLEYLKSCDENSVDNLFFGPEYFKKSIELNIISPNFTVVRVNQSPAPDALYFVNGDFLLESRSQGKYNMSAVAGQSGVHKPEDVLKNKLWSIHGLRLYGEV